MKKLLAKYSVDINQKNIHHKNILLTLISRIFIRKNNLLTLIRKKYSVDINQNDASCTTMSLLPHNLHWTSKPMILLLKLHLDKDNEKDNDKDKDKDKICTEHLNHWDCLNFNEKHKGKGKDKDNKLTQTPLWLCLWLKLRDTRCMKQRHRQREIQDVLSQNSFL